MKSTLVFLLIFFAFTFIDCTEVSQCPGKNFDNLNDRITISNCKKPPCKLKRKTTINIMYKFKTANYEVKDLTTTIKADVLGILVPFIGVDGLSACGKIFETDETTPVPCPLKANTDYVYKNSFPILEIYPRISTKAHWDLHTTKGELICFDVDVRVI